MTKRDKFGLSVHEGDRVTDARFVLEVPVTAIPDGLSLPLTHRYFRIEPAAWRGTVTDTKHHNPALKDCVRVSFENGTSQWMTADGLVVLPPDGGEEQQDNVAGSKAKEHDRKED